MHVCMYKTVDLYMIILVPTIEPKVTQSVQNPNEGSSHNLTCTFELPLGVSSELLQMEWSGRRSLMSSNPRVIMSNVTSTVPQQYTKTVTFQQVQRVNNGNYTCTVNITGFTTSFNIITVNGKTLCTYIAYNYTNYLCILE